MGRARGAGRKGFPDNLYQNPDGYFYYINPMNKRKLGVGRDKAAAFREARQANAVIANMTPSTLVAKITGTEELTLQAWVPLYKSEWVEKSKPAKNTLRNQEKYLDRIAASDISWMTLRNITTAHCADFLDEVEKSSGAATSRLMRARLADVFRMAETKGMIDAGRNPVTSTYKAEYDVKRERLSLEVFLQVRDLKTTPPWLRNAMNLALLSSQRREDIAAAEFTHWENNELAVVQGKSQGKTRLKLSGDIGLAVVELTIADVVKQCRDNVVSRFLIHRGRGPGGGKVGDAISEGRISNAFAEKLQEAGYAAAEGRTPPSFHEIRSLSERLYREQYGAEFAQAMLGHKNAKMTAMYDDLRGSGWRVVGLK